MASKFLKNLIRRRKYVVDRPMQYGAAAQLLVGLVLVALLGAVGLFVFLGDDAMASMNLVTIRQFLLLANAIYFVLTAVILIVLTLLLTHRFAGPAWVIDQAIRGMRAGDYSRRLKLRKHDYFQELAGAMDGLRCEWVQFDEAERRTLEKVQHCLQEKRYDEAERLVADLRTSRLVHQTQTPPSAPEAAPAAEAATASV